MESTGVYWKPIYNLLEEAFTPLLINARHIKVVPGRKTDVKDCEWIAHLLRHGLLRGKLRARTTPKGVAVTAPLPHGPGAGTLSPR